MPAAFPLTPEELLQQFDESQRLAGIGSWSWDLRTGAVAWSRQTYRVLRVSPDVTPSFELVLSRAVDPAHAARFVDEIQAALRGEREYDFEIAARAGTSEDIVILHTRGAVIRDEHGQPIRMSGTVQDVTAIRRAEEARRESDAQFRTLADASPIGVFRTGPDGLCTYANQRLLDWFGCDLPGFAQGEWFSRIHPDDVALVQAEMARTIGQPVAFDAEYRIMVDGETRWVRVRTEPIMHPSGSAVLGHVGSVLDASREHQAQEERARLQGQLEQARRAESLGLLAGGIAHDFNNLLVGILGNASHLREELEDGPAREVLGEIAHAARRAAELTRQLLAYAGRARLERKPVPLAQIVGELPLLLGTRIHPHITFDLAFEERPIVDGDEVQLRQVVLNLVTNAIDAIGERPGTVTVRLVSEAVDASTLSHCLLGKDRSAGRYAVLSVEDTGSGMSPEVRERMFDPFFTTKSAGRGLGLSATLGILQAHGGAIEVTSTVGRGTTIRLFLPSSMNAPTPIDVPVVPLPMLQGDGTLLLVDDDDGARAAARRILSRAGFTVIEATNGAEALQVYDDLPSPPRGVLLDLAMPVMGGAECLSALRARGCSAPILMISGFDPDDVAAQLVDRGDAQLLRKPYAASELLLALKGVLR